MVRIALCIYWLLFVFAGQAQTLQRCASIERLQQKFKLDKRLQLHFEQQRSEFNKSIESGYFVNRGNAARLEGSIYVIPVVVHIVLPVPTVVTDETIAAQLEVLNRAFAGTAADSLKIPEYFKSLSGKSILQFCLAQQTPDSLPTSGIHRVITTRNSFSATGEAVKYSSAGGTDSWNPAKYMNIWITALSGGILGYSSFPDDGSPQEQGVVIDYRALPGGVFSQFDNGKTLVHEAGHFFDLYHIWGDDNGTCSGTDYVDDTPPQANSTTTCQTDKLFDGCTPSGNGVMYQNYMDYTEDECLIMFTAGQILRMEAAATTYRFSLLTSNVCVPVSLVQDDISILSIDAPAQRLCGPAFNPVVTIQYLGMDTLRSARVRAVLSNGDTASIDWQGSLDYRATASVELPSLTVTEGIWLVSFAVSHADGSLDENGANDTLSTVFQYYDAVQELSEGFEDDVFPPRGWDVVSDLSAAGWTRVNGVAASGRSAAVVENPSTGSITSLLRSVEVNLQQIDSAWISFAYAGTPDTFALLVSMDCGAHYSSIYTSTQLAAISGEKDESLQWRRDSVNISAYIDKGDLLFAFSASIPDAGKAYLDDINIRKVIVNPNLKSSGFMVTPNPVSGTLMLQFYPQPSTLKRLVLYSVSGQMIKEIAVASPSSLYTMDMSSLSSGMYIIAAIFSDKKLYKKIIKR